MNEEKVQRWSKVMLGLLVTTFFACSPINEEPAETPPTPFPDNATPTVFVAQRPTDPSPTTAVFPTAAPAAVPPPAHTPGPPPDWVWVGDESVGMQIAVPPTWVDMRHQPDELALHNQLGLATLLAANSERTGLSLLGGKQIEAGAVMLGLLTSYELPTADPVAGLEALLADLGESTTAVSEPAPFIHIKDGTGETAVSGATLELQGAFPGIPLDQTAQPIQTRILFFTFQTETNAPQSQIAFLFAATANQWPNYETTFHQMAETIIIHQLRPSLRLGDGTVAIVGNLEAGQTAERLLNQGGRDLWTFRSSGQQFATFRLQPQEPGLDLALQLFKPSGQIFATIDNGFDGDTEVAADIFLDEPGTYIAAITDFSAVVGRYQLQFSLMPEPQAATGGTIQFGESVQVRLAARSQHVWTFQGTASQLISVVVTPGNETFDPILDLYGPDGQRLLALDEGFSGDAEIIAGFQLPVTGQFSILVRNFADDGDGTYALALDEGGESTLNFFDAGDLVYGSTEQEQLRSNEAQAWFFQGGVGDQIMVKVLPLDDTLDLELWVLDPDVERLMTVDEHLLGEAETAELELTQKGQYLILVRDYYGQSGQYRIQLMATEGTAPVLAGELVYGQTAVGTLTAAGRTAWQFTTIDEATLNLELMPTQANSDLVLALSDPNGRLFLELDEAGAGEPEQLQNLVLPTNGRWQIVIREFFGQPAAYQLTLQPPP